jgi:hypothetical protein
MVEEGLLIYVSEPHLRGIGKNGEDDANEDPSPREEGKSAD